MGEILISNLLLFTYSTITVQCSFVTTEGNNFRFKLVVKFFPPDPGQLHEEFTRYLFALQIKRDIKQGLLSCNGDTITTLAAYVAQCK